MMAFVAYKHRSNTDVAMLPIMVRDRGAQLMVRCRWFNIVNPKNRFDLGITDEVYIKLADLKNWRAYDLEE
jgi:hypothetical protein